MDNKTERIQVSLPVDVLDKLDAMASHVGLKRSPFISMLISQKWKEEHADKNREK